ncbi:MAG: hypothetical protein JSS99_01860 [Actinobacteria bacterium]|nr:hypothetical protein [Actinomycetota bacterium]
MIEVATHTVTTHEHSGTSRASEPASPQREDRLRTLALEQIYRVRRFKLHLVVFAVGLPALGILWVLTEYFEEHTWPSRFASAPAEVVAGGDDELVGDLVQCAEG